MGLWPNENWSSLFAKRTLAAPIAAATQSYNLDADFIRPSDDVFVEVGSKTITHKLVEPQLRDTGDVYITGKTLNFNETIEATDERVGGDIVVTGFYLPADLDAFTDTVPVDDPNWLALERSRPFFRTLKLLSTLWQLIERQHS